MIFVSSSSIIKQLPNLSLFPSLSQIAQKDLSILIFDTSFPAYAAVRDSEISLIPLDIYLINSQLYKLRDLSSQIFPQITEILSDVSHKVVLSPNQNPSIEIAL